MPIIGGRSGIELTGRLHMAAEYIGRKTPHHDAAILICRPASRIGKTIAVNRAASSLELTLDARRSRRSRKIRRKSDCPVERAVLQHLSRIELCRFQHQIHIRLRLIEQDLPMHGSPLPGCLTAAKDGQLLFAEFDHTGNILHCCAQQLHLTVAGFRPPAVREHAILPLHDRRNMIDPAAQELYRRRQCPLRQILQIVHEIELPAIHTQADILADLPGR